MPRELAVMSANEVSLEPGWFRSEQQGPEGEGGQHDNTP